MNMRSMKSSQTEMRYNGIVIGGGPAGMFAAITAAQNGASVLLLVTIELMGKAVVFTIF